MRLRRFAPALLGTTMALAVLAVTPAAARHPQLLFDASELETIRAASSKGELAPIRARLMARAERLLGAAPLVVSTTKRGEPDPPGELKGLEAARRLQGRVLTYGMALLLAGEQRYRDAAVSELDHALAQWPIWVDTAHQPPFDLMTGENCLTFAVAYDWLYDALTPAERTRLREGVERRALAGYLDASSREKPPFWFTATMNWNPVTNGGATMLALALGPDSALSERVLKVAPAAMAHYWNELGDDGGWAEGTGYWTYGHRYAFMAADALRRAGRPEGTAYLARPGARTTGYFPIVFNPGHRLSASFGDSPSRANDPIYYLLAREYHNPDFAWFQDQAVPSALTHEGWPEEALTLVWKSQAAADAAPGPRWRPTIPPVRTFTSIGWAMLAPSQPAPPFFLAFKNGSLAASHTHLDLNHVSVGVGDTMVIPDLGSRPYPADYFDEKRRYTYYETSTAGHNTVLVGGKGQVVGREGRIRGPFDGSRYVALTGIADNAYEIQTPCARRHIVFVDSRYFVLLDELQAAGPTSFELRFHSYGSMRVRAEGGWTLSEDRANVAVVPATDTRLGGLSVTGRVEAAEGWTKPVNVLRLRSGADSAQFVLATAIFPWTGDSRGWTPPPVLQTERGYELLVDVGTDRLTWRRGADGYQLTGVTPVRPRR
jgi:hypothetical protein